MSEHHVKGMSKNAPKVGVGILIFKDGMLLLGKRKKGHGAGEYEVPGGYLDYMESFEECARRETREETGLEIKNIKFLDLQNLKKYSPDHFVDVGFVADWKSGEPKILEPDFSEGWNWYDLKHLPRPLFEALKADLLALKTGKDLFDD